MKKLGITAGVMVLLGVIVLMSMKGGKGKGKRVQVEKAAVRTISARVKATGAIMPEKKVDISAKVVGEITELPVVEGQAVKRGQVLAQIERTLYEAARDQAKAAMRQAEVVLRRLEAETRTAKKKAARLRAMYKDGLADKQKLEDAELAAETASIQEESQRWIVRQRRSAWRRAQEDLERTTLRSPMAGKVIALNVERGETAIPSSTNLPGSVLMTIADVSSMSAEVQVGEIDVVQLKVGQPAEVHVDALGDERLEGTVSEIERSGVKNEAGVVWFKVKIRLKAVDPRLRPGMTAKADILTATHRDRVSVPIGAVRERRLDDQGKPLPAGSDQGTAHKVVFTVKGGRAHIQPVETGLSDELYVEILKGIKDGRPVVVGPYRMLKNLSEGDLVYGSDKRSKPTGGSTGS